MAIVAPMAEYRQLAGKSRTPLVHDIICVHTMVGTLEGSISWSSRAGGSYWHFGLGGNGRLVQCQDLQFKSAANLNGNWHVIPIETADTKEGIFPSWSGSNVPAWTPAQLDKLVDLIAWLCRRFNIPPVLIPDTRKGRRGIAYHRQGVDPWRVSGGELWSKAYGKVCPGDRRIHQLVNIIIPRVQARLRGGSGPTPPPPPRVQEDDDMFLIRLKGSPAHALVGPGYWHNLGQSEIDLARSIGIPVKGTVDRAEWDRASHVFTDGKGTQGTMQNAVANVLKLAAATGESPLHDIIRGVVKEALADGDR